MLQHSPPRRSPRLQNDNVTCDQPVPPAASGTSKTRQTKDAENIGEQYLSATAPTQMQPPSAATKAIRNQHIPAVPTPSTCFSKTATPVKPPPKTLPASVTEMQEQIAILQRQLSDTQAKLCDSNRQCQELHLAIQGKDQVSDHNLENVSVSRKTTSAIDPLPPTTFTSYYTSQPHSYTTVMSAMQTVPTATSIIIPPNQVMRTMNNIIELPTLQSTTSNMPFMSMPSTSNYMHGSPATNCRLTPSSELNQQPYTANAFANSVGALPRKLQDLPEFSGDPEDWPLFFTSFVQSTTAYGYTNLENNQRLHKSLKGNAREVIKSLLIHPDNVNAVIEQLKFRFGRPEQLIHSQLRKARELPHITENSLVKFVPFSTKVKNLAVFLQSVNGQNHIANPTLLEELVAKLPMSKKLDWARVAVNIQPYPTIIDFSNWLSEVANLICSVQEVEEREHKRRVLLHTTENRQQCPTCQGPHKIYDCEKFLNLGVQDRWKQVKKIHACFSCLNVGHSTRDCRRKKQCLKNNCQRKHNRLLHEDTTPDRPMVSPRPVNVPQSNVLSCSTESKEKLLFRVLPVTLYGVNCHMDIYALFDDGSSIRMLNRDIADKIGVRGKNCPLNIQWFGGQTASEPALSFNVKVSGQNKKTRHLLKNVYAVSNLNLPMQSLTQGDIEKLFKDSSTSPVKPYSNIVPKMLIGMDNAHLGLPSIANWSKNPVGPFACNTELGWVVFGPCHSLSPKQHSCLFVNVKGNDELHQMITNYFDIENMGVRTAPLVECEEDIRAKRILNETTKRVGDRFQTGLLWKHDDIRFPNNYCMALRRLEGIERKMKQDAVFSNAYKENIQSYIDKGYVRKVAFDNAKIASPKKWYLPHFAVINHNKPGKLRMVFDAAASKEDVSLNSQLLKGPQDIASLPSTLYNFRKGQVAVSADIREMFHQILVQPCDRISQRFLWRNGNTDKLPEEYEMMVMIFGAACSPCSALHVMKTNAREHHTFQPRAIKSICDHHYMDDFVDSFDGIEEAIHISQQVKEIHKNGGFQLRGFISNSKEVAKALNGSSTSKQIPASNGTEKVLGLFWEPSSDNFMFNLKFHGVDQLVICGLRSPTKREVLSIIMSIFDLILVDFLLLTA